MVRREGEALVRIVRQICSELGPGPAEYVGSLASPAFGGRGRKPTEADLGIGNEALVGEIRLALAELSVAAGDGELAADRKRLVAIALDGVELVIRGQLTIGKSEQLQVLLPSIVFLVVLPAVEQDEALWISGRATELVEASSGA